MGAADLLAVLRTLLAAADGAVPRHPEAARQLHDVAREAGEAVLAASQQETRDHRRRDALTVRALRAAAAVDGFSSEVVANYVVIPYACLLYHGRCIVL